MNHTIKQNTKQEAADTAKNYYENAKESVTAASDYIADKAHECSTNIQSQFSETEEKLINYTKANPFKALGMAALLGYLISKVL